MYGMKALLYTSEGKIISWLGRSHVFLIGDIPTIWSTTWEVNEWIEAKCLCPPGLCPPHDHPPCKGNDSCGHTGCGFHAATHPGPLWEFMFNVSGTLTGSKLDAGFIMALVEGGGEIAVHDGGFRAQYMRIIETFDYVEHLERAYRAMKQWG